MHLNWKNFEMLQEHMVLKQHLDLRALARGARKAWCFGACVAQARA